MSAAAFASWYYRPAAQRQEVLAPLARAAREAAATGELPGLLEAVPGYTSLYLEYDPQQLNQATLQGWLEAWQPQQQQARPPLDIPVCYDGEDLPEISQKTGLSIEQIVRLHTSGVYRVRALGFVAGFPFMETTPPALQLPRRPAPRPRVPAHSLAVAGPQTGIYPVEAPGGWNLLGRALVAVYDPHAQPPFLVQPGDQVRFVAQQGGQEAAPLRPLSLLPESPALPLLEVQKSGVMDLVMDEGRLGSAHYGLVRSGALDAQAARIANELLGNPSHAPLLEMHLKGPTLRVLSAGTVACTGGLKALLNGQAQPSYSSFAARPGDTLSFGGGWGRVGYLALVGGLETQPFLGSSSSDLKAGIGRALQVGEVLGACNAGRRIPRQFVPYWVGQALHNHLPASQQPELRLRLLPISAGETVAPEDLAALQSQPYTLRDIDRMAARLQGPALRGGEIKSEAAPLGTIQVPPSGEPIILLHDKGTLGGYRKPARVYPGDLPRLVQASPPRLLRFVLDGF